jgi:RNase P/RNase MRP subunit POP5
MNNVFDAIKDAYTARFGPADLEDASLKVIENNDNFLLIRCNLDHYERVLETLSSIGCRTLNMSGTLKALRSRAEAIKTRPNS